MSSNKRTDDLFNYDLDRSHSSELPKNRKDIHNYLNYTEELKRSNSNNYENNVTHLISFLRSKDWINEIVEEIESENIDYEEWRKSLSERGSMVGSGTFRLPFETEKKLAILWETIKRSTDLQFILGITMDVAYDRNITNSVRNFVRLIVEPFDDLFSNLMMEKIRELTSKDPSSSPYNQVTRDEVNSTKKQMGSTPNEKRTAFVNYFLYPLGVTIIGGVIVAGLISLVL